MKKIIVLLAVVLISSSAFAQQKKELKLNEETNLIEATYYHENGEISQQGTFNLDKRLHGDWIAFNDKGEKISQGAYVDGMKTGKWQFWNEGSMKEVEFNENAIASITDKKNSVRVTKN